MGTPSVRPRATGLVALAAISGPVLIWLATLPPLPQPPDYHDFADQRTIAGVPHFWNVASNLPFALVGGLGLGWLMRNGARPFFDPRERHAYALFFAGGVLTCAGSVWYHADPSNATLVWDRLAFSLTLTSFFSIVLSEFVSAAAGRALLVPLAAAGLASVGYWAATEAIGQGDLRAYAVVQFYPVLAIPFITWLFPPRYPDSRVLFVPWALYVVAKACELGDAPIYAATGVWSGHTLKHLVAALALAVPLLLLARRAGPQAPVRHGAGRRPASRMPVLAVGGGRPSGGAASQSDRCTIA